MAAREPADPKPNYDRWRTPPRLFRAGRATPLASGAGRETVLTAMPVGKAQDAFVVRDQRAREFDRGGNQQSIGGIAMLEVVQLVAATGGAMAERHRLDPGTTEEARHPRLDRQVQFDPPNIDEQRNFPYGNCAQADNPAISLAVIDPAARCRTQAVVPTVEPERNMRVEQQGVGHR